MAVGSETLTPREQEVNAKQSVANEVNKTRSGVGLRKRVGQTRGKNPIVIEWEAFDESQPDTLPKSVQQFIDVTSVADDAKLTELLITGFNASAYESASDPLAEYVQNVWPSDVQAQFRIIVRNYSRAMEISLEDSVNLVQPGFFKKYGRDS